MNRVLAVVAVAFLLLLGPACGKDDDRNPVAPGPPPAPTYPVLSAPESVLVKLRRSYENRDTLAYVSCYEAAYQGASYDTSETPGFQPATFTFAGESAHIRALALNPNITSVDMFLPTPWTRATVAGTGGEQWARIAVFNPQVGIVEGDTTLETAANGTFEFSFRPTTPAPGSPTDTLWHIVQWVEAP